MKPKTLILMLVALGCGLAGAFLPSLNQDADVEPSHSDGLIKIVVAQKDIAAGTRIDNPAELFKVVHYRKGDEPKNSITELESLKGKIVVRALAEDQPVKERDVGPP